METYYFQAYVCSEGSIGGILIFDCEVTKEQAETLASAQNIGKKLKEMEFKDNLYLKIMEEAAKQAGPVYSSREFLQKKTEKMFREAIVDVDFISDKIISVLCERIRKELKNEKFLGN